MDNDNLEQYLGDKLAKNSPYYFIQPDANFGDDADINESLRNGNYYNESYWKYVPYRNTRANKNHTSCSNYLSNEPIFLTNTGFASCTCNDFGIHENFAAHNDTNGDEKMENHPNEMEIKLRVESTATRTIEPHAPKKNSVGNSEEKNYLRSISCDGYMTEWKTDRRRVSMLVDELLLKIYGSCDRKFSSPGTDTNFLEYSTDSSNNLMPLCKNSCSLRKKSVTDTSDEKCSRWNDMIRNRLMKRTLSELRVQKEALEYNVSYVGSLLLRQLKRRDLLSSRQDAKCDIITAFLQAKSAKRSEDTKIQFSMKPNAGESGFQQWHGAMKMVARLSGGIPREFRKTLWLTLAERHVTLKNINWDAAARNCFNDSTNPDDEELGVQIVKDLHRTGCSLFSGTSGEENQAVLKRVLLAYARWNKTVGYCQGFNMLAALILEVMDRSEYDSLKVMIYLIEGVLPEKYFADNLRGLSIDMAVFRDLLRLKLPELSKHLEELQTDSNDAGNAYEPPLTNVFTMQWFLTLFCNCLPHSTVLRVWDLIFLEGNQILLKTALAIWDTLSDRITPVKSADEFYSIMGVLTREMLEFGLMDANNLIKTITNIELSELTELRERYIYNITPWTQVARKGLRLFYSDDETDDSDDESNTDKTAEGAYGFLKVATKQGSQSIRSISPSSILGPFVNEKDKIASDISTLRKQYGKIKERQKQAQIIFKSVHNTPELVGSMVSSNHGPVMNHLLLNKNNGCNVQKAFKAQKQVPAPVSVPVPRAMRRLKDIQSSPLNTSEATSKDRGETVYWDKRTKKRRRPKAVHYQRSCDSPKSNTVDNFGDSDSSSYSSSTSSFKSSSSTELCDELGEFDSEDANTSLSEYCASPHCRLRSSNNSLPEDDKFPEIVENAEDLPKSKQELPLDVERITGERNCDFYNADREQILNVLLTTSIIANEQLSKQDLKDVSETASRNETKGVVEEYENEANFEASRHNDEVKLNNFMQNVERITRRVSCIPTSANSAIFKTYSVDNINNYTSDNNDESSLGKKSPPSERENATNSDIEKELENMKINALEILFSSSTLESIRKEACEKILPVVDDSDDSTLRISLTRDTELALQQILQENTEVLKKVNQTSRKTNLQDSNDCFADTDRLGGESTSIFSGDTNTALMAINKNDRATDDSIGDATAKDIRTFEEEIFDYPSEDDRENGENGKKYKSLDSLNKTSKLKMGLIRDSGEWISISIDNSDLNVNVDADDGEKVENVSSFDTTTSEDESDKDAKMACEPVDRRTWSNKPAEKIHSNSQPPTDPYLHLNFNIIAKGGKKKTNDPIQQYVEQKNILTRASKTRELTANTLNFNPFPSRPHSRPPKELGIKLGLYSSTKK